MTSRISEGEILEYRMQRLFFYLGYFTRRRITLKSYFYPEKSDITDLDIIGITFSNNFYPNVIIGECKSGAKESTIDRILWISGLRRYFSSNQAFIARKHISQKIKDFAREMNVLAFDYNRIFELEKDLGIIDDWMGSHDLNYYQPRLKGYYQRISQENKLSRIYWFIRSEFWYTNNSIRLKKLITASEILSKYNRLIVEAELREALKWLIYESAILFSVSVLYLCGEVFSLTSEERERYIDHKMMYGLVPPEETKKIIELAYKVVNAKVREKTGEGLPRSEMLMEIPIPSFTSNLIELVERLLAKPKQAVEIPRFLDIALYEYCLKDKEVDEKVLKRIFPHDFNLILKLSKNILNFIIKNCNLAEEFFGDLLSL